MKVKEVIVRAIARKIRWWQAAEVIGISDRPMRRWRERYEELGFRGLFDRCGKPAPKPGHLHLLRTVFCCGLRRYCFRWAKPRIFAAQLFDQQGI
jgi:Helix-turn-helix domain